MNNMQSQKTPQQPQKNAHQQTTGVNVKRTLFMSITKRMVPLVVTKSAQSQPTEIVEGPFDNSASADSEDVMKTPAKITKQLKQQTLCIHSNSSEYNVSVQSNAANDHHHLITSTESPESKQKVVILTNGNAMTIAEYKWSQSVTKRMGPFVDTKSSQSQSTEIVEGFFDNSPSADSEDGKAQEKVTKQIKQRPLSIVSNSSAYNPVQSIATNEHPHLITSTEAPEGNHKVVILTNGNTLTLAEYERLRSSQMPQSTSSHNIAALRGGLVATRGAHGGCAKRDTFLRKRMSKQHESRQQQQQLQQHALISNSNTSPINIVNETELGNITKIWVILKSGEQRLITFILLQETWTVKELLNEVQIPFTKDTNILCYKMDSSEFNYIVTVGLTEEEAYRNITVNQELREIPLPPKKHVEGMLAVCQYCGYTSVDHVKCERCKRLVATGREF